MIPVRLVCPVIHAIDAAEDFCQPDCDLASAIEWPLRRPLGIQTRIVGLPWHTLREGISLQQMLQDAADLAKTSLCGQNALT